MKSLNTAFSKLLLLLLLLLLLSIGPRWLMPPNVLQPYWLIILCLDVPDLTASLLLRGPSGQWWGC